MTSVHAWGPIVCSPGGGAFASTLVTNKGFVMRSSGGAGARGATVLAGPGQGRNLVGGRGDRPASMIWDGSSKRARRNNGSTRGGGHRPVDSAAARGRSGGGAGIEESLSGQPLAGDPSERVSRVVRMSEPGGLPGDEHLLEDAKAVASLVVEVVDDLGQDQVVGAPGLEDLCGV